MRRFHVSLSSDDGRIARLQGLFSGIKDEFLSVDEFSQFVELLKAGFDRLSGSMSHRLDIDFEAYNPSNYFQALRVQATDGQDVRTIDEIGTGEEQILAMSFAQAYATAFHGNVLLVIEEPESHLHPLAQAWLAREIRGMADSGIQILITTHSPRFVNLQDMEGLVLVRKEKGVTKCIQKKLEDVVSYCLSTGANPSRVSATSIAGYYRCLSTDEILSGFFARKVVIVEGKTESEALPVYFRSAGLDVYREGIAVVPVEGKSKLAAWWRIFTAYGIPTFVVFDNDAKNDPSATSRLHVLRTLGVDENEAREATTGADWIVRSTYCVFGIDFETCMKRFYPSYAALDIEACESVGESKPLRARYVAERLDYESSAEGKQHFVDLVTQIRLLGTEDEGLPF